MTAQVNDPLNAFVNPQGDSNQAVTSVNDQNTNTTSPTPVLPVDNTQVQPQAVGDMTSQVQNTPVTENPLDTTTPPTLPSQQVEEVMPVLVNTQTNEEVKDNAVKEDDENESPLQALAKKLAKLRDELIQEKPEEEATASQPLTQEIANDTTTQETTKVTPAVDEKDSITTPTEQTTVPEMTDQQALEALNNAQEGVTTDKVDPVIPALDAQNSVVETAPTLDTPVSPVIDDPLSAVQSELANNTTTPGPVVDTNISAGSPMESDVLAGMQQDIANAIPTTTPTPTLQPTTDTLPSTPNSTLEQLYPEVVDDKGATPVDTTVQASANQTMNDATILDESDNTQADPALAESAALAAKYPLSINKIMDIAIERNASDIQISVGYPVMIKVDGLLIPVNDQIVSPANAEELILPTLSEQKKELLEVNREVDLAYTPLHNVEARFRINAYFSKNTLTAAFRLIPSRIKTLEELMLPPIYTQLTRLSQGLILVTGPTGHGKSTTLAAMIQSINLSRAVHIITIEDPIEYMFKPASSVIDQREMHDDTHSWTVALKSALRQAPDVILVGEMRDYETIASAITLAETGHLVFATLHTNSASQTVDRIIDVFPENQQAQIRTQLSNILEAVIAQRLLPVEGGGRRAVSEIMLGTPAVRNLIREGKTHQIDNVIRTSADVGMISLEQSLVKLVREGLITMERAQEYAVHPEEVVRLLKS